MLTADEQSVDARHVGYTVSNHENSAVELAIRIADATDGSVTLLTVGPDDAVEQLRNLLGLGCHGGDAGRGRPGRARSGGRGPRDCRGRRRPRGERAGYDLVLLGNDAADSGDFQVGIRLAYASGWPVVNGAPVETADGRAITAVTVLTGEETFSVPLPAVVTVLEGGVEPRYPSLKGRMAAKKIQIESRSARHEPQGSAGCSSRYRPPSPATSRCWARARPPRSPWSTCWRG